MSQATWDKLDSLEPTTRQVAAALIGGKLSFDLDPVAIQRDIVRRMFEADTVEDALTPIDVTHAEDILDVPLLIRTFKFNPSEVEGGVGAYAMLEVAEIKSGEVRVVSSGSVNVMAALIKLAMENALPFKGYLHQLEEKTAQGFYPMVLRPFKG